MTSPTPSFGVRDRLRYRFDLLLSQGTSAVLLFLGIVTLTVVIVGSLLLTISGQAFAGSDDPSLLEDFWQTMLRTMDPGTMAADVGWGSRVLALLVTLFGILIAGTLIGLIASGIEQRVEEMQRGRSPVVESDHVVVLGSSPRLAGIVDQLTLASRQRGGRTIVVLADCEPRDLAEEIRATVPDTRGSRLVFRRGDPTRPSDLALVGIERAREVIVLADEEDSGDARSVTATLALGAELGGFDRTPIVVELNDVARAMTLAQACGGKVHPMVSSQAIARLTAFALDEPGLNQVVEELLDFEGASFYIRPLGDLAGATFGDAIGKYTKVRPIGLMEESGHVELNPARDTVLQHPTRIVVIADDDSEPVDSPITGTARTNSTPESRLEPPTRTSRTLIVGWSTLGALFLEQLVTESAKGSFVQIVYDERVVSADELALPQRAGLDVTITPTNVDVWQPHEDQRLAEFTTIIVLASRHECSSGEADSRTLLNLMTLTRAIEQQGGERPRIVAELIDERNVELAALSGADDSIVSDAMASRLLVQLAEQPERRSVYLQLYAHDSPTIRLIDVEAFGLTGQPSWADIVRRVDAHGLIALGWRQAEQRGGRLAMNPNTEEIITLGTADRVVVIG